MEYKLIGYDMLFKYYFAGGPREGDTVGLTKYLNRLANEGWRIMSMKVADDNGNRLMFLLQRGTP